VAQTGSAFPWGGRGRRFKSAQPDLCCPVVPSGAVFARGARCTERVVPSGAVFARGACCTERVAFRLAWLAARSGRFYGSFFWLRESACTEFFVTGSSKSELDVNAPESWAVARRLCSHLGPIPSSVGNVVKSLWKDHLVSQETGKVEISKSSNSTIRLVDKSSVLKMPLFFAAQSLYADRFEGIQEDDTSRALIRILHPGLFASLLSLLYLHRRFNKICSFDEWEELSKQYILNMELGFLVGKGCPRIGEAVGVLVGGIRYAALAIFLRGDKVAYEAGRNRKMIFDVFFEHEKWRCDHGQIAGLLLRSLGITPDYMQAAYSLRGHGEGALQDEFCTWSVVVRIIEALKMKQDIRAIELSDLGFSLSDEEVKGIKESTDHLFEEGSTFTWMLRSTHANT
jgi:hypothetical protein